MPISIDQLFYHPIKSLGGISTNRLRLSQDGPERDRHIMVVNDQGKFVTQRQKPIMSMVKVVDDGHQLTLSLDEKNVSFRWPNFFKKSEIIEVTVWGDELEGQKIEGPVNSWLSDILKQDVQLVYKHTNTRRQVDMTFGKEGDTTGFSDGFPVLLISQPSIDFLQSHLDVPISMARFRPNISVTGCEPFEEDSWKRIRINDVEFDLVKPCSRCVIPTIDLKTGKKQKQVMQVMLEHRKQGKQVYVGQNLIHRGVGEIAVGAEVEVLERY